MISTGGDSKSLWGKEKKGGDAVSPTVRVLSPNYTLVGGKGNPNGTDFITLGPYDEEDGKVDNNGDKKGPSSGSKKINLPKTGSEIALLASFLIGPGCLGVAFKRKK